MKRRMRRIATIAAIAVTANWIPAIPERYRFQLLHKRYSAWRGY